VNGEGLCAYSMEGDRNRCVVHRATWPAGASQCAGVAPSPADQLRAAISRATPLIDPRVSEVDWDRVTREYRPG
jgi:hypothetical protein